MPSHLDLGRFPDFACKFQILVLAQSEKENLILKICFSEQSSFFQFIKEGDIGVTYRMLFSFLCSISVIKVTKSW